MLYNYLNLAWRNLRRQRVYTAINVLGLSLGTGCAVLIFTLISYQLQFDNFHPQVDRTYRAVVTFLSDPVEYQTGVPAPFMKAFKNDFSFADTVSRVFAVRDAQIVLPGESEQKKFDEEDGVAFAEANFFSIFRFPLARGTNQLGEPNTALITQHIAKKYFGTENAVGKVIRYDNKTNFRVTGILADLPDNTDRRQEIYLSYLSLKDKNPQMAADTDWNFLSNDMHCFMVLKPGVSPQTVNQAFSGFAKKYYNAEDAKLTVFSLQPLRDIHFNTHLDGTADKKYLWGLGCIGLFLIVAACVNFVNLATATALSRAREVGVRKVMGSRPRQLFWQFMMEAACIVLSAFFLGYWLAYLGLPYANQLFKTHMTLGLLANPLLAVFLPTLFFVIVFLSGAYPALVLARFNPVAALKSKLTQQNIGGFPLRRVLVITQFAIAQLLIICMIVVTGQIRYAVHTDLGFTKDATLIMPLPVGDPVKMHTLQSRIANLSGVENTSLCSQAPASGNNSSSNVRLGNRPKDENWNINDKAADDQYLNTFHVHLVAGRNLFPSDTMKECLVNETAVSKFGLKSPHDIIGQMITIEDKKLPVVGVMKDFHNRSFHDPIEPMGIYSLASYYSNCAVRVNMAQWSMLRPSLEKIWNDTYPQYVYTGQFLDDRIEKFYSVDNTLLKLVEGFSAIAILISCLGLYGLVSFMAVQKTKEIGVRKVLGAKTAQILWLFGREFTVLLAIGFLIGAPVAWWAMTHYLQGYTYRVSIGWQVFALALAATIGVAAVSVTYRSLKAAHTNPIKSLRTE